MSGALFSLIGHDNKQDIWFLGIGGHLDDDVFNLIWSYFCATKEPGQVRLANRWIEFKSKFIGYVKLIENRRKYILKKRREIRLMIGHEIEHLPKVGIRYYQALESFSAVREEKKNLC